MRKTIRIYIVALLLQSVFLFESQAVVALPTITIDNVTKVEGNTGTTQFDFTLSIDFLIASSTVDVTTADGTATSASGDYVAITNPPFIEFTSDLPGQLTKTFSVIVNGDVNIEADETFFVNLSNVSGAVLGNTQGIGTITNDDLPTITINDTSINEGNAGATTLDFSVSISDPVTASVQVDTADVTATAGSDYVTLAAQTVNFIAGGATTQTVSVTINGDTTIETDETFNINLTNAVGATIADAQGVGTITNDDSASFSINDVNIAEGNTGTSILNFTVSKVGNAAASVDWATSDGTATIADNDYLAVATTTLNFTAAQTSQNVSVTINGDTVIETNETFNINLSNSMAGATISDNLGIGTIMNDDVIQTLSAIKSVSGNLIPGGSATYSINISNPGTNPQNDNPGNEMTDILPVELSFVSASATSGTVTNSGNTVTWNGSIPASGNVTVTINTNIVATARGEIANQAIVSYDSNGDNINDATALSDAPTMLGPTMFFIPFSVPSSNWYGLLILCFFMVITIFKKKLLKT